MLGWHTGISTPRQIWVIQRAEWKQRGAGRRERCGPAPGRPGFGAEEDFERAEPGALEKWTELSRTLRDGLRSALGWWWGEVCGKDGLACSPTPGESRRSALFHSWARSSQQQAEGLQTASAQTISTKLMQITSPSKAGRDCHHREQKLLPLTEDGACARHQAKHFTYIISRNPLRTKRGGSCYYHSHLVNVESGLRKAGAGPSLCSQLAPQLQLGAEGPRRCQPTRQS